MKYKAPKLNSVRVKKGFAFLPVRLYDKKETIWLEFYRIEQRYCDWGNGLIGWKNIHFL